MRSPLLCGLPGSLVRGLCPPRLCGLVSREHRPLQRPLQLRWGHLPAVRTPPSLAATQCPKPHRDPCPGWTVALLSDRALPGKNAFTCWKT